MLRKAYPTHPKQYHVELFRHKAHNTFVDIPQAR